MLDRRALINELYAALRQEPQALTSTHAPVAVAPQLSAATALALLADLAGTRLLVTAQDAPITETEALTPETVAPAPAEVPPAPEAVASETVAPVPAPEAVVPAPEATPATSGAATPATTETWAVATPLAGAPVSLPAAVLGGDDVAWGEALTWAARLQEGDWERAGRADAVHLRQDVQRARKLLIAGDAGWAHALARAFSQTALIDPRAQQEFSRWMQQAAHQECMAAAWTCIEQPGSAQERMEAFLEVFPAREPLSQGARLGLGSALLGALGDIPFYRPTTARTLGVIVDHPVPSNRAPEAERWDAFLHLAAQVEQRGRMAGLHMQDGADLLGVMTWVAEGPAFMSKRDRAPGRVLTADEQEEFWDWHRRRMPSRKLPTPPWRKKR